MRNFSITFIVSVFVIWAITVFALWFPNLTPSSETAWSILSSSLTNIMSDCWAWYYVQWFKSDWFPICKSKSSFSSLSIWLTSSNYTTNWHWLYTKYLGKILNDCWTWRYIIWFDNSNKNLKCMTKNSSSNYLWTSINLSQNINHIFPTSVPSWWEQPWWVYTSEYFNKIFYDCWPNKYLQWYNSAWAICGNIVTWACWVANNVNTYIYPISGHCLSWSKVNIDITWTDLTYNWNCVWDLWPDVSCSAKRIVNWWWSSWWSCSVSCWWWSQSRTCTNPAPANWWTNCVWSSSQSCNTQACCNWTLDSSGDCCAPAWWSYCRWKSEYGVDIPWRVHAYKRCDTDWRLHCEGESDYRKWVRIDCNCN